MTTSRIKRIDARFFNERAMRVYEESDLGALELMLEALPDHASDEDVADELESFYNDLFQDDEEDLADGDLEDQLENLLAEGDREDRLNNRYVVLVKLNGFYGPDMNADTIQEAELLAAECYAKLDRALDHEGGDGSITIFDREDDHDVFHVQLVRYKKGV